MLRGGGEGGGGGGGTRNIEEDCKTLRQKGGSDCKKLCAVGQGL